MLKYYKQITLILLCGLVAVPSMATCAPDWDDLYVALEQGSDHTLRSEQRAILQARVLMKMHRPAEAKTLLAQQQPSRLVALMKIEADRQSAVEAVRRAGGTAREVHLQLPDDLEPALNKIDSHLARLTIRLKQENDHSTAHAAAKQLPVVLPVQSVAVSTTPASNREWQELAAIMEHGHGVARGISSDQRLLLQVRSLMKGGWLDQAQMLIAKVTSAQMRELLAIELEKEQSIAAVRRAGGSAREVKMQLPDELDGMLARLDQQLETLLQRQRANASEARPASLLSDVASGVVRDAGDNAQPVTAAQRRAVLNALEAWRTAWSERDLERFFASYASDVSASPRFSDPQAWRAYKQRVISARSFIRVAVEDIEVIGLADGSIRVEFLQHYSSDAFNARDYKYLLFRLDGGEWRIVREDRLAV